LQRPDETRGATSSSTHGAVMLMEHPPTGEDVFCRTHTRQPDVTLVQSHPQKLCTVAVRQLTSRAAATRPQLPMSPLSPSHALRASTRLVARARRAMRSGQLARASPPTANPTRHHQHSPRLCAHMHPWPHHAPHTTRANHDGLAHPQPAVYPARGEPVRRTGVYWPTVIISSERSPGKHCSIALPPPGANGCPRLDLIGAVRGAGGR
jgi:hypothetical protein